MPKKSTSPPLKPTVSLDRQISPRPSQPGHGMITHGELGRISDKLNRTLGKKGAELTDALQKEAGMHGGVLKERHFEEVIHDLERNHHDGIGKSDIDKLKNIADHSL